PGANWPGARFAAIAGCSYPAGYETDAAKDCPRPDATTGPFRAANAHRKPASCQSGAARRSRAANPETCQQQIQWADPGSSPRSDGPLLPACGAESSLKTVHSPVPNPVQPAGKGRSRWRFWGWPGRTPDQPEYRSVPV